MKAKDFLNRLGRWAVLLPVFMGFCLAAPLPTRAQTPPYYELPLCLPVGGGKSASNCLPFGAAQSLATLEADASYLDLEELAVAKADASYNELPIKVARLGNKELSFYNSPDGGSVTRTIPASEGLRFVSVMGQSSSGMVQSSQGDWVQAETPLYSWPRWQGLIFYATPRHNVAWTVNPTPSYQSPSFNAPHSAEEYDKFVAFPVYDVQQAEGYAWYLIGPNTWIPSLKARLLKIVTAKPAGVQGERWIRIDLEEQTLAVYEEGRLIFGTVVATGYGGHFTELGVYQIYEKRELDTMMGSFTADRSDYYYLEGVPWALYYNKMEAIHGVYWPSAIGFKQSHGCVNMFTGDARWLFEWAKVGDFVVVEDPSGQTPTTTQQTQP